MKKVRSLWKTVIGAGAGLAIVVLASAGAPEGTHAKPKPYPLTTCIVSGEKLGGDMGEPYVFTHEGREIKLCCKSCLKDFNKEPGKFIKKLEEVEKANVKPSSSPSQSHGGHQH